jgi:hypothetical protein
VIRRDRLRDLLLPLPRPHAFRPMARDGLLAADPTALSRQDSESGVGRSPAAAPPGPTEPGIGL